MATHANWLLNGYVYGYALQVASLPSAHRGRARRDDRERHRLRPDEFPYLNESAAALVAAGYDPAEEFTFGLTSSSPRSRT